MAEINPETGCIYSHKGILQLIFDRPTEPMITPRGDDARAIFDVPDSYLDERIREIRPDITKRFDNDNREKIPIKNISLPDISVPQTMDMKAPFSLFNNKHIEMAEKLIKIFMDQKNISDLICVAAYCHDRMNPYLFNYALSVAILHRKDTRDVTIPNFLQIFPGKFVDNSIFGAARAEAAVIPVPVRKPIILPREFTANSKEPEQKVAYFREDIGINLHHWHWHLVYPGGAANRTLVAKDRRGELFYYMHQQIIARYNAERFANGLPRVISFDNLRVAIKEGYFPKLTALVASHNWPGRQSNTKLSDLDRDRVVKLAALETAIKNIKDAIAKGSVVNGSGTSIPLTEKTGVDVLGDIIESSLLSPNQTLYGSVHNLGHMVIAGCHDPDGRYLEPYGVMSDTATAMRDPVFYRWHNFVNDLFVSHKDKQPKYTVPQLEFTNVCVTSVQVTIPNKAANTLITHLQQSDVDLSRGLDFTPRSAVLVRFTHLQHEAFNIVAVVKNASKTQLVGYARVFIAPKFKEGGATMPFNEQRKFMIEIDKFRVTLVPGNNTIKKSSNDSSVTIPFERTFRSIDANRPADTDPAISGFNFCGCGWPQHMLIPKGTTAGMKFDLFFMVSNYENDKIVQDVTGICDDADSYCGIQDKKYPDKKSMGYPFDRVGRDGVDTLAKFLTPNMKTQEITIKFEDRVVIRAANPIPTAVIKAADPVRPAVSKAADPVRPVVSKAADSVPTVVTATASATSD